MLLLLPDYMADNFGQDIGIYHVDADDRQTAVDVAQDEAFQDFKPTLDCPEDMFPLAAFAGHHDELIQDWA